MRIGLLSTMAALFLVVPVQGKPAHLKALADYIGPSIPSAVNQCRTCHLAGDDEEKPHNAFGKRLADWRKERRRAGQPNEISTALDALADEDADKDGAPNLVEVVTGRLPGESADRPSLDEKAEGTRRLVALRAARADNLWEPLKSVTRPAVPAVKNAAWVRNPIDAFVAEQHQKKGLTPRPEAARAVLLRRVYLDLIGLPPTPGELHEFLADQSPTAYEAVVDRLLQSPQYGEAQARHWMDVWRYSDWAGYGAEVRDSQPHIWRWRDWIVESLNGDRGYDQLIREMLAADELFPDDPRALRATGFLVRNWYKFSREIVLDRTVEHTAKAFLGMTINCAKCHDHMYDPISQAEFYAFRAIFQAHDVRTDRLPGQADLKKDGLVRIYDAHPSTPTYLFVRGNEKEPDQSKAISPGVPTSFGGSAFRIQPVNLPDVAVAPDNRPFVIAETKKANEAAAQSAAKAELGARARFGTVLIGANPWSVVGRLPAMAVRDEQRAIAAADVRVAEFKRDVFAALLAVEQIDQKAKSEQWTAAATRAETLQREQAFAEAKKSVASARLSQWQVAPAAQPAAAKKLADAEAALARAESALKMPPTPKFTPRPVTKYPATSTGRRTALANWIADSRNPLTARVAINHLWLRRFGTGLVPTVFDFGKNGQVPTHPRLLDWLAAELMARNWSLKDMHRLMVTSATYRMDSNHDAANGARDPDNQFLWRMPARRMTAEAVRDAVLFVAGELDPTAGGPDLDHNSGMTIKRRSLYFRHAPEKQMVFLELFDAASPTECYRRSESVVPQQALALANSPLTQSQARVLARKLNARHGDGSAFILAAFETVLSRSATSAETGECLKFLGEQAGLYRSKKLTPTGGTAVPVAPANDPELRARESLVHVLMNHNDFVMVR